MCGTFPCRVNKLSLRNKDTSCELDRPSGVVGMQCAIQHVGQSTIARLAPSGTPDDACGHRVVVLTILLAGCPQGKSSSFDVIQKYVERVLACMIR